jgi:hypothetical protein
MTDIGIVLFVAPLLADSIFARWLRLPVGREAWWVYGVSALIAAGVLLYAYGFWVERHSFMALFVLVLLGALPVIDPARRKPA